MKNLFLALCCLPIFCLNAQEKLPGGKNAESYSILDFGASRDNTSPSTEAINRAVDRCHENGGGKVIVPAGKYTSGIIILKDNVELHLEAGAFLYASDNWEDFPDQSSPTNPLVKNPGLTALIYAQNAEHISISGNGVIDGLGQKRKRNGQRADGSEHARLKNLLFVSCRDVNVSGVSLNNSQLLEPALSRL